MQGAQILRNEAYTEVRCNDEWGKASANGVDTPQVHESRKLYRDAKRAASVMVLVYRR
jgi:hypothetical protein